MSAQQTPAFETKHYVYGQDVSHMSANELIESIKKVEAEITDLKLVKTKSAHILTRVAELGAMLTQIVAVLDAK